MAHAPHNPTPTGKLVLNSHTWPLFRGSIVVAAVGLGVAMIAAMLFDSLERFFFAYLIAYAYFLSIALGAMFFVLLQHLTKAGWSVSVRRVAEMIFSAMPMLAVAFAPIFLCVAVDGIDVYRWRSADAHHTAAVTDAAADHDADAAASVGGADAKGRGNIDAHTEAYYVAKKSAYLNPLAFLLRWAIYFVIWIGVSRFYWRTSLEQDRTGDPAATEQMQQFSAPALILLALTTTFAAFDLLMSLSPAWYSTIFGVYYFTGAMAATFATLILLLMGLQRWGYLGDAVTTEHYHDLGKFLFGFVFFWGYIAFSQYMLIWYASLPETTFWYELRGASTAAGTQNGWTVVSIALMLGHFFIPFAALLSRHVKRSRQALAFWSAWVLVFHFVDLWWLAMPELGVEVRFGLPEIGAMLGVGGIMLAGMLRLNGNEKLVAVQDPRLHEALRFHNA